jgi:DNA-binding winged helix-turn-helix (wHTH) protein
VTVEEGSLRVHLSALRKALGDGQFGTKYIENVQGRGYCLVVPVKRQADDHDRGNTSSGVSNLSPRLSRMIGRDDALADLRGRLLIANGLKRHKPAEAVQAFGCLTQW